MEGTMKATAAVLAAAMAMIPSLAVAQTQGSTVRGPIYFTGADRAIVDPIVADMLRTAEDGEVRSWRNPDNGHSGELVVVRSYSRESMLCRDLKASSHSRDRGMVYSIAFCETREGRWMMANR
jgi:surface antigen